MKAVGVSHLRVLSFLNSNLHWSYSSSWRQDGWIKWGRMFQCQGQDGKLEKLSFFPLPISSGIKLSNELMNVKVLNIPGRGKNKSKGKKTTKKNPKSRKKYIRKGKYPYNGLTTPFLFYLNYKCPKEKFYSFLSIS